MFNEKFEKCLITFLPVRLITLKNMYGGHTAGAVQNGSNFKINPNPKWIQTQNGSKPKPKLKVYFAPLLEFS